MTQQVNLYQPILRQQRRVFSSRTIALIVAGVTGFMLLLWAFNLWQVQAQEQRLAEIRDRETATATEVARLTRELGSQTVSTVLRKEVEELRAERSLKERLYQTVFAEAAKEKRAGDFSTGFVPALEALGRRRVDGLWIDRIAFADSGRHVLFAGRTQRAELVPQLVQGLGNETALETLSFSTVRVVQDGSRRLAFRLSTRLPEDGEGEE